MVPDILSKAPEWASTGFWAIVAIGAAASVIHRFFLGAKIEGAKIERTGKPTPTHAITGETPQATSLGMGTLQVIGGAIVERQQAQEHIETGRAVAAQLEALVEKLELLAEIGDRIATAAEREAHRAEVLEEARRMAIAMRDEEERRRPS